jgi:hypothetical protein
MILKLVRYALAERSVDGYRYGNDSQADALSGWWGGVWMATDTRMILKLVP